MKDLTNVGTSQSYMYMGIARCSVDGLRNDFTTSAFVFGLFLLLFGSKTYFFTVEVSFIEILNISS